MKNPKMQLVQQLGLIPVAVRVIISGTPIQNNIMEMHALFDFACEVGPLHFEAPVLIPGFPFAPTTLQWAVAEEVGRRVPIKS